ncbi:Caspase-3 [Hypsibius exemplaris]|uniref:Caspase-3 n=1 Tax=Hypsibius exemplaris TaxID=2072580 RepID=A0A1W0WYR5_HYPEX|nr:Caspase-3 [Hypsibius exemplaris]
MADPTMTGPTVAQNGNHHNNHAILSPSSPDAEIISSSSFHLEASTFRSENFTVKESTFTFTHRSGDMGGALADEDLADISSFSVDNHTGHGAPANGVRILPWNLPENRQIIANGGFTGQPRNGGQSAATEEVIQGNEYHAPDGVTNSPPNKFNGNGHTNGAEPAPGDVTLSAEEFADPRIRPTGPRADFFTDISRTDSATWSTEAIKSCNSDASIASSPSVILTDNGDDSCTDLSLESLREALCDGGSVPNHQIPRASAGDHFPGHQSSAEVAHREALHGLEIGDSVRERGVSLGGEETTTAEVTPDSETNSLDGSILSKVKFFSGLGAKKSESKVPTKSVVKIYRKEGILCGSDENKPENGAGDRLDARPLRNGASNVPAASLPTGFYSMRYFMGHPRRGTAVIINNRDFTMPNTPFRKGSDNDAGTLFRTLLQLGFHVESWTDLTVQNMRDAMVYYAKMDHKDADCFWLSIFSHGEDGVLYGTDGKVNLTDLTAPFRGDKCLTLAGKPKLFVIQACRGDQLDSGVDLVEADAGGSVYRIPAEADFLYAFSTPTGYFSWRNTELGSWFIQSLCRTLSDHAAHPEMDILRLLTRVNYEVSMSNESNVPGDAKWHRKKQIPSVVSMLTKDLFFTPKANKSNNHQ